MLTRPVWLFLGLLLACPRAARADDPAGSRHYQEGMARYAAGDQDAALVFFRKALRESPGDPSTLAAVRRVEAEIMVRRAVARRSSTPASPPASAGAVEHFLLVAAPRWFYFERTVGNGLRDIGTLTALNARIVQLLGERKIAIAQNRVFRNERQLRELLRRAPLAA